MHDMNKSIEFFDMQFSQQVASSDLTLNPFEAAALPYLRGRMLDFGCGLGNLSVAAARRGCQVLAIDAASTAIRRLAAQSAEEGLSITALNADLRTYAVSEDFDAIVAIGLLMFFGPETARRQLARLQAHVRPGGVAIINVLIEGTTFLDMFDPMEHYLFRRNELREAFVGWEILSETFDNFPTPRNLEKCFATIIARKPSESAPAFVPPPGIEVSQA
jgi:tellurite methyltransferase